MLTFHHFVTQSGGSEITDSAPGGTRFLVQPKWSGWLVLAVFVVSILVTVVFLRVLPSSFRLNEQSDYHAFYEPVARSILAGRGLSRGYENPATEYPPGYPLVLAGVFWLTHRLNVSEEVGLSTLAVLGVALVSVFVFLLARIIWGPLSALVSSLIWMTYPFALWLTKQPNTEIPFMVAFYGGLFLFWYALLRRTRAWPIYFACGLLFGVAMLVRPIAIGIGVVMGIVVWFVVRELTAPSRLVLITMLLLGNLVAVLPWEGWVYFKTGKVILLGTVGVNGMRDGLTFGINKDYREGSNVPANVQAVMDDIHSHLDEIVTFRDLASTVAKEFRARPLAVAELLSLKAARCWYGTDSGRREWPILLIQAAYLATILSCARKLWRQGGIYRQFLVSVCPIVIYFWGMTFLALSILRYMVPVMGLLFILIGGALHPGQAQRLHWKPETRKG